MEARDRGYTLYKKGMKYKEIAEKIGVPLNTVKSWATRYWKDGKVATKAKPATKPEVATSPRKAGAPKGNVNAVGNKGGAPFGNTNAMKHGGYSTIWASSLTEAEREALEELEDADEETILVEEIRLLTIREARIMKRIKELTEKEKKSPMMAASISTSQDRRDFKRLDGDKEREDQDKELYIERQDEKIQAGKILPGNLTHVSTISESTYQVIHRLEVLLTDVQRQKTKAASMLANLRLNQKRLEFEMQKVNPELEDISDTEDIIYGHEDGESSQP
ncbi:sigma factor-like helix-turn-helix DNA-binding protein [Ruthenibacterium lactatiformans]|uniref:helix-turn-helix domain-containing protein n=1 Tax=Ruthenibacterium lactatiformans TaxID=1550024 RepID=UPI002494EA0E|nr:sigma factor-like helix-turn-helix DNA-binding protein [Ruthenibacterium lactatiformans]